VPRPAARPAHPVEGNEQARTASRPAAGPVDLAPQRTAALQQPTAPAAAAPAAGAGSSFVQISSHQSESEARGAFASAQRRYPQLQGYSANIRAAELPGRGTWYRLRVGPFSRTDAQGFCERLKTAGGSCVLN
jgi:cell division protein FtsN